jgi:hypothetical protein
MSVQLAASRTGSGVRHYCRLASTSVVTQPPTWILTRQWCIGVTAAVPIAINSSSMTCTINMRHHMPYNQSAHLCMSAAVHGPSLTSPAFTRFDWRTVVVASHAAEATN